MASRLRRKFPSSVGNKKNFCFHFGIQRGQEAMPACWAAGPRGVLLGFVILVGAEAIRSISPIERDGRPPSAALRGSDRGKPCRRRLVQRPACQADSRMPSESLQWTSRRAGRSPCFAPLQSGDSVILHLGAHRKALCLWPRNARCAPLMQIDGASIASAVGVVFAVGSVFLYTPMMFRVCRKQSAEGFRQCFPC
jgi:hypothetical protein